MEKEDILINLKVLANIQINEKLISRSQYLNVEYVSVVPLALRRWLRQDNRMLTLSKIRLVLHSALAIEDSDKDVLSALSDSVQGLKHLKETYSHCTQTQAQIDVFIDSIENM
tara:strand:+ start:1214 stop:1552 length:339 start_codon:yes stop_codon:yes gene_type:complete